MKKNILVVDDDRRIVMALTVRLQAAGYDVSIAYDPVMMGVVAKQRRPDLILLDISMPGGNGFMVAEWMQDWGATMGVPIIFLTASKQPGLRERAKQLGAAAFFEKPYEAAELLRAIRRALGEAMDDSPTQVYEL